MKWDGLKSSTAIHGPSGRMYHPIEEANATADSLETQFTLDDLCDENHEQRVEARFQALERIVLLDFIHRLVSQKIEE
jgi:hypothetical protein